MTQAEQELNELRAKLAPAEPVSPTLAEMNQLSADIEALRSEEEAAAEVKKAITAKLEAKEARVLELLLESGSKNYKAPNATLSLSFRLSAKLPVGEEKTKFFDYLKSIGRFDDMVGISSPTYTAYVKERYDLADEAGEERPSIPGVTEVKESPRLSFRRTR